VNREIKRKACTFEEFCFLVKHGQKADLIEGVIYMASPDNTDANRLNKWLLRVMEGLAEELDQGEMFFSRVAFRLDDQNAPEPDLAFVKKERLHLVKRGSIAGPPDLAVEIVSPDSVERDYKKKRAQYQQFGVPEYWIIDELEQKVVLLRLDARGRYREVRPKKGVLTSEVLKGFWLRPGWLWQDPRPQALAIAQQLLAGVPGSDKNNSDS